MKSYMTVILMLGIGLSFAGCGSGGGDKPAARPKLADSDCTEINQKDWEAIEKSLKPQEKDLLLEACHDLRPSCLLSVETFLRERKAMAHPSLLMKIAGDFHEASEILQLIEE
jgi:hypothetical protein